MVETYPDSMKKNRDHLLNLCNNGHAQCVYGLFCSECGEKVKRKYNERSWDGINFKQSDSFSLIYEKSIFPYDDIYISSFNKNILFITNQKNAILLRDIDHNDDFPQSIREFRIPTIDGEIDNVLTDHRKIYIQSDGKIWTLDWIDLLNNDIRLSELTITGHTKKIQQAKYIYAFTAKQILQITSTSTFPIVNPIASQIVDISSYEDNILVITRDRDGILAVQTNSIQDKRTLTQEVIINDEECFSDINVAVGARYYAVASKSNHLQMGSLSKLKTSQTPEYRLSLDEDIAKMFFIKDYLYIMSNDTIYRWDLNNFTEDPEYRKTNVNVSSMMPSVNFAQDKICVPIRQGRTHYLEIVDLNLIQATRSSAFPQPLKTFSILDNQVVAITKEADQIRIYNG